MFNPLFVNQSYLGWRRPKQWCIWFQLRPDIRAQSFTMVTPRTVMPKRSQNSGNYFKKYFCSYWNLFLNLKTLHPWWMYSIYIKKSLPECPSKRLLIFLFIYGKTLPVSKQEHTKILHHAANTLKNINNQQKNIPIFEKIPKMSSLALWQTTSRPLATHHFPRAAPLPPGRPSGRPSYPPGGQPRLAAPWPSFWSTAESQTT